jgi:hypothetical protein
VYEFINPPESGGFFYTAGELLHHHPCPTGLMAVCDSRILINCRTVEAAGEDRPDHGTIPIDPPLAAFRYLSVWLLLVDTVSLLRTFTEGLQQKLLQPPCAYEPRTQNWRLVEMLCRLFRILCRLIGCIQR